MFNKYYMCEYISDSEERILSHNIFPKIYNIINIKFLDIANYYTGII